MKINKRTEKPKRLNTMIFNVDQSISSVRNTPNIDEINIQKTIIVKTNNVEYCRVNKPNCNLCKRSIKYRIRIKIRIEKTNAKNNQTRRFRRNAEIA